MRVHNLWVGTGSALGVVDSADPGADFVYAIVSDPVVVPGALLVGLVFG